MRTFQVAGGSGESNSKLLSKLRTELRRCHLEKQSVAKEWVSEIGVYR